MSRSTESKEVVRRQLEDYNLRSINTPEIFHALNRAQQDLATRYDLIRKQITINTIEDEPDYDVVATDDINVIAGAFVVGTLYQITSLGTTNFTLIGASSNNVGVVFNATGVGVGTGIAQKAYRYVKKIKSFRTPHDWCKLYYKTDQEFDEILEVNPDLSKPLYLIYRNNVLTFHGAPTEDDESVVLQTYLSTPVIPMSSTVDPAVPDPLDKALEEYAIGMLLPVGHAMKQAHINNYEALAQINFSKIHNNNSFPLVPRARW